MGLFIAVGEISNWDMALRFIQQVPFGERDPIFGKDIGFYLFSLPAYIALKNGLLHVLFCSAAVAGVVYGMRGDIHSSSRRVDSRPPPPFMVRHCSVCSLC